MIDIEFLNREHERALAIMAEPPATRWCKVQRVLSRTGDLSVMGNVFGAPVIYDFRGLTAEVRFDPLHPEAGADVFTLSGKHLGLAELVRTRSQRMERA